MRTTSHRLSSTLLAVVAATAMLSACGRNDDRTAGEKLDSAVATSERKADQVAAETREAGRDAKQAAGNAVDSVANTSKDVAITAEIKTKLAADSRLSALAINVDTNGGRVVLRGTAPDDAAREHATSIAKAVDGVTNVTNELTLSGK